MAKFLSLDWFKERVDIATEKVIIKKIDQLMEEEDEIKSSQKPYHKATLVNDVLTVVLNNGDIISKGESSPELFEKLRNCSNELEINTLLSDKNVLEDKEEFEKECKKIKALSKGIEILKGYPRYFTIIDNEVYLTGISRTLPQLLVEEFINIMDEFETTDGEYLEDNDKFVSLRNFFMWCCLNPRAEVANELYRFLMENGFKITKQGFFVALRNVVDRVPEDSVLVKYISNAYSKVKAVWKKSVKDYEIVQIGNTYDLKRIKNGVLRKYSLGVLEDLYLDLPNMQENRFTDNWTRTMDIRIGKVVSMPKEECDWSTQDCARAGLHFAGHTAPYVLCGDTTVFTLHNPMKVVGIGVQKGRCWEYLPFMTTSVDEANQIMNSNSFDFLQLDEEYAIRELEDLNEKVKEGFTKETKKHKFNLPNISSVEISTIVKSLSEMKLSIDERVKLVE